jgi:PKD repeat protein
MTTIVDYGDGTILNASPDMALHHEYTIPGNYTASLTGVLDGVEYESVIAIEVYPSFTPVLSTTQPLACTNCTPDMTIVWTINGTVSSYTGIGPHDFGPDSMQVQISATTAQGCEGNAITIIDAIDQISKATWSVFPNPANDMIAITGAKGTIRVRNASGNLIQINLTKSISRITLDSSDWASGIYFLEIQDESTITTKKIVVLH